MPCPSNLPSTYSPKYFVSFVYKTSYAIFLGLGGLAFDSNNFSYLSFSGIKFGLYILCFSSKLNYHSVLLSKELLLAPGFSSLLSLILSFFRGFDFFKAFFSMVLIYAFSVVYVRSTSSKLTLTLSVLSSSSSPLVLLVKNLDLLSVLEVLFFRLVR